MDAAHGVLPTAAFHERLRPPSPRASTSHVRFRVSRRVS